MPDNQLPTDWAKPETGETATVRPFPVDFPADAYAVTFFRPNPRLPGEQIFSEGFNAGDAAEVGMIFGRMGFVPAAQAATPDCAAELDATLGSEASQLAPDAGGPPLVHKATVEVWYEPEEGSLAEDRAVFGAPDGFDLEDLLATCSHVAVDFSEEPVPERAIPAREARWLGPNALECQSAFAPPAAAVAPEAVGPAGEPLEEVLPTLREWGYDSEDLAIVFGALDNVNGSNHLEQLADLAANHPDPNVRQACDIADAVLDVEAAAVEADVLVNGEPTAVYVDPAAITEAPTPAQLQAVAVGLVGLDPLPGLAAAVNRPPMPLPARPPTPMTSGPGMRLERRR